MVFSVSTKEISDIFHNYCFSPKPGHEMFIVMKIDNVLKQKIVITNNLHNVLKRIMLYPMLYRRIKTPNIV